MDSLFIEHCFLREKRVSSVVLNAIPVYYTNTWLLSTLESPVSRRAVTGFFVIIRSDKETLDYTMHIRCPLCRVGI